MREYSPARNIFAGLRAWPKTLSDFAFGEARFMGISGCHLTLAAVDPFRPGRSILLRRRWCSQSRQGVAIIPGHPLRRTLLQCCGVPQQFGQIVERIGAVELA